MAKRTNEERHFHRHRNQQFGSIWANAFQSQAKSGSNQNLTYDCHLVIGKCQCSVLDAVSEHARKVIGSAESERREDPRWGVYRMVRDTDWTTKNV